MTRNWRISTNKEGVVMDVQFLKSEKKKVQGKREEIYKKYGKEWEILELGNSNGNWSLNKKKSDVLVNGVSCRDFVLERYSRNKLTEKLSEQFCEDIINDLSLRKDLESYLSRTLQ